MTATGFAAAALGVTAVWLAAYRLPFASPRVRQRVRLAVASATRVPPKYVFPLLGTVIYLVLGVGAAYALSRLGGVPFVARWQVSLDGVALTLLVAAGASALTAFAMSLLYAFSPRIDVPGAVSGVRWIQEILVLPPAWRWLVPMLSAAVEEYFFRGTVLLGLLRLGAPVWAAIAFSGAVFVAGQALLTERKLQALVLALSSIVLSVLCGLLTAVELSVLPAILIHASFAGYYTNMSARRAPAPAHLPR